MYFVCPACATALRVDPSKVPEQRATYTCRRCHTRSVVQDHLQEAPPAAPQPVPPPPVPEPDLDGTVYHHINDLAHVGVAPGSYGLRCGVKDSGGEVRTYAFDRDRITLGRGEADLRLDDPLASRVHAEVERVKDRLILKDLESTNGTYLNGRRVSAEFLEEGDVVRIGNTLIKVKLVCT